MTRCYHRTIYHIFSPKLFQIRLAQWNIYRKDRTGSEQRENRLTFLVHAIRTKRENFPQFLLADKARKGIDPRGRRISDAFLGPRPIK